MQLSDSISEMKHLRCRDASFPMIEFLVIFHDWSQHTRTLEFFSCLQTLITYDPVWTRLGSSMFRLSFEASTRRSQFSTESTVCLLIFSMLHLYFWPWFALKVPLHKHICLWPLGSRYYCVRTHFSWYAELTLGAAYFFVFGGKELMSH